jgi:hypothetical protein
MNWLLPHPSSPPLPSAFCLSFSVFLSVAGRASLTGRGGRSQITRRRESLVLYKSFNPLCPICKERGGDGGGIKAVTYIFSARPYWYTARPPREYICITSYYVCRTCEQALVCVLRCYKCIGYSIKDY